MSIHNNYQESKTYNPTQATSSPGYGGYNGYSVFGANPVAAGIHSVNQAYQGSGTGNLGQMCDMRRMAMIQQMSFAGQMNPNQKAQYDDATKAKALGNFAELTDAQMEVAVLKNWEQKINSFIQIA